MKRAFAAGLLLLSCVLLTGCDDRLSKKVSYSNGGVLVEYFQTQSSDTPDTLTFNFYERGSYYVTFSQTLEATGRDCCATNALPKDFEIEIDSSPRVYVTTPLHLPDCLHVAIHYHDVTESHDLPLRDIESCLPPEGPWLHL